MRGPGRSQLAARWLGAALVLPVPGTSTLAAEPPVRAVGVDVDELTVDEASRPWFAQIYKELLLRITAVPGLAAVGPNAKADIVLRLSGEVRRLEVTVASACSVGGPPEDGAGMG